VHVANGVYILRFRARVAEIKNYTSGVDAKTRKALVIINLMNLKTKASERENNFREN